MSNFSPSGLPVISNVLNTIVETSRESHTDMSDFEGIKSRTHNIYQNPLMENFQQAGMSSHQARMSNFLSSNDALSTPQGIIAQKDDNYQTNQAWSPQTTTGFTYSAHSNGFSGAQPDKALGFGFANDLSPTKYGQTNDYLQANSNQNNQATGVNHAEDNSSLTEVTGDLSHMSIGNFKKAFHQKDNSYNLNLTKMDESSLNHTQSPQKKLEGFHNPQGSAFSSNLSNLKANYGNQPADLLNFVNSNAYGQSLGSQAINPAVQHQQERQEKIDNTNAVNKNPKPKIQQNDTKELESLLADLDPLELSEIAPLSDNFLDDDEENTPVQKALLKKQSKELEAAAKAKEVQKLQQESTYETIQTNLAPGYMQSYNGSKEENIQYNPYSNYISAAPTNMELNLPTPLSYNPQNPINNYASNQVTFRTQDYTNSKSPISSNNEYATSQLQSSPYQSSYLPAIKPSEINIQPQSQYASETRDSLYKSTYNPQTTENQFGGINAASYQINSSSSNTSPWSSVKGGDIQSAYQSNSTNYTQNTLSIPSVQSQGSIGLVNSYQPLKSSQVIGVKEYHNPFVGSSQNYQSNQSSYQQTPQIPPPFANEQQSMSMGYRQSNPSTYRDVSPNKRVEEEADEIVNKMQNLYQDWKQKNAELNQYLNELVHTASQNKIAGSSFDRRSDSPINQSTRKTTDYSIQRNTTTTASKSTLPYDFRYSVQTPGHHKETYQSFMKEDFLKDVEQPDERQSQTKPAFKKFSNPIFEKPPPSKEPRSPFQRNSAQEETSFNQNAIPRNTAPSPYSPFRAQQEFSKRKEPSQTSYYNEPMGQVPFFSNQGREGDPYEFRPKFTKHHEQDMFNYQSSSPPKSERVNVIEREEHLNKFNFPANNYKTGFDHFKRMLFGYKVKKNRFIQGVDERKVDTKRVEILCNNCQEFINTIELDRHYELCSQNFRRKIKHMDTFTNEDTEELNSRLRHLRQTIMTKMSTLQTRKLIEIKIKQIIRFIDTAIYQDNSLKELGFLINESERLIEEMLAENLSPQDLSLMIYFNRFVLIAKQKYAGIQVATLNELELLELQSKLFEYEKEMPKQNSGFNTSRDRGQMMINIQLRNRKNIYFVKAPYVKDDEVLSQINSDIESSDDGDLDDSVSMATTVTPLKEEPTFGKPSIGNPKGEPNKIKFYSMVVNDKLLLPPSHPSKDLLISDLYDECLKLDIPEEKWECFIRRKLGLE